MLMSNENLKMFAIGGTRQPPTMKSKVKSRIQKRSSKSSTLPHLHLHNLNNDPDKPFTREYMEAWKKLEIENYNMLLSTRAHLQKELSQFGTLIYDLLNIKNILFSSEMTHKKNNMSSKYQKNKNVITPSTFNRYAISDLLILTSNIYMSFLSLKECFEKSNEIMFVHNDDENYEFIPFRLLMRQYINVERSIRKYENDLALSYEHIKEINPRIKGYKEENERLKEENEILKKRNKELELQNEKMKEKRSKKSIEKGDKIIRKIKENKNKYERDFKKIKDLYENEIVSMSVRLDSFQALIDLILDNPSNKLTEDAIGKLKMMQIHLVHLIKKFSHIKSSLSEMKQKVEEMMKKKIDKTEKDMTNVRSRFEYNQKLSSARKSMEHVESVIVDLNNISKVLGFDVILSKKKKKKFHDTVIQSASTLKFFTHELKTVLNPLRKSGISEKDKKPLDHREILDIKDKSIPDYSQIKSKMPKIEKLRKIGDEEFVSKSEHDKLKLDFFKRIKTLESWYKKRIDDLEKKLFDMKRKRTVRMNSLTGFDLKKVYGKVMERREKKNSARGNPKEATLFKPFLKKEDLKMNKRGVENVNNQFLKDVKEKVLKEKFQVSTPKLPNVHVREKGFIPRVKIKKRSGSLMNRKRDFYKTDHVNGKKGMKFDPFQQFKFDTGKEVEKKKGDPLKGKKKSFVERMKVERQKKSSNSVLNNI